MTRREPEERLIEWLGQCPTKDYVLVETFRVRMSHAAERMLHETFASRRVSLPCSCAPVSTLSVYLTLTQSLGGKDHREIFQFATGEDAVNKVKAELKGRKAKVKGRK